RNGKNRRAHPDAAAGYAGGSRQNHLRAVHGNLVIRERGRDPHQWRSACVEHDPEKWIPGFRKRSCSNNNLERDDDSKKSHHALAARSRSTVPLTPSSRANPSGTAGSPRQDGKGEELKSPRKRQRAQSKQIGVRTIAVQIP